MSDGFVIVYLLGAVQGVFLAAVLLGRRRGAVANRLLALVMLTFAADLAAAVYHATALHRAVPHLIGADAPLALLYGPLLLLYAQAVTRRRRPLRRGDGWHFVPFAALVLALGPFFARDGAAKLAFLADPSGDPWTPVFAAVNGLKLLHALAYVAAILVLLRRHRRRIRDTFSSVDRVNLAWLRNLLAGVVALTGVALATSFLTRHRLWPGIGMDPGTAYDDYTLLSVAVFVYAIGLLGLRQPEVFDHRPAPPALPPPPEPDAVPPPEPDAVPYAKSGMDAETARAHRQRLLDRMAADRLYRQGDLTLQDLADALSISPHNLTEVINTQLGQSFYDFVNGCRVEDVQARLADPRSDRLTLLALGLEAGFNSKSSFNAVFKKHTGMTPSQYRAQVRAAASAAGAPVGAPVDAGADADVSGPAGSDAGGAQRA